MIAKLFLIGAGPGDPELITLKALRKLEEADVILYDSLINLKIFDLLEKEPKTIFVGKRQGLKLNPQEEINQLILEQLKLGKKVARLKGGDPFVFARGVEEMQFALEHGFEVEVIPGLTSSLAVASCNAITLTLRGQSDSLTMVTGHNINDEKLDLWAKTIKTGAPILCYMGLTNVVEICKGLEKRIGSELATIAIENGSLDEEKQIYSNLKELPQELINQNFSSPVILVFGENIGKSTRDMQNSSPLNMYC